MSISSLFKPLLLSSVLAAGSSVAFASTTSYFNSGSDGWLLAGDSTTSVPDFVASGGNPGGYIHGIDETIGGVWFWLAPDEFLHDKSLSYGQTLSFDLRMRGVGTLFGDSDVILGSSSLSLHYNFTGEDFKKVPADTTWSHYVVNLSDSAGWKVNSISGEAANQAQIKSVLGNLSSLKIRGEYISGPDNGDLDNVILTAVPEPESYAMLLAGLGMLYSVTRRRKSRHAR